MVTLAQSSPGDRSARAPQSKTATVMLRRPYLCFVLERRNSAIMLPKLYIVTLDELLGIFQRGLIVGAHKSNCSADKTVFVHDVSSILGHIGVTPKVTTDHINPGTSVRFRNHCDGVSLNRLPWNHGKRPLKKKSGPGTSPEARTYRRAGYIRPRRHRRIISFP